MQCRFRVLTRSAAKCILHISTDTTSESDRRKHPIMAANEQVQKYYEALIASYDILTAAVSSATERGLKVGSQFAKDVTKGQRDALELGKKLATSQPNDLGQFYTAVLEATTAAQGRSLAFTQVLYQEALGAGDDTRQTIEKLVAANKATSQAAVDVARQWAAVNPFADFARKSAEAFTGAAKSNSKKKAAV